MKNLYSMWRIVFILVTVLSILTVMIYIINPLVLPKKNDPNSRYFNEEWFNKIEPFNIEQYQILNRWAHYYGKHGCEPELENCSYRGVVGQWKLLFDYIGEEKPFPVELIKVKVAITREKAINLARNHIEEQEFYKYLPSKEFNYPKAKLTEKGKIYWQIHFTIPGLNGYSSTLINPENGKIITSGFTKPLELENGILKNRE